jgi:hypothetical protein
MNTSNLHFCYLKNLKISNRQYALSAKGKQWGNGDTIDIAFIGGTTQQQKFVRDTAQEWLKHANLKFNFGVPRRKSEVRISFTPGIGSWSYVGTDALYIAKGNPTMNFSWLDKGVVLHEFGHMLGLLHEHQHPDIPFNFNRDVVVKNLSGPPNNWDIATIEHNVLNKERRENVVASNFDSSGIMMYIFPTNWISNGKLLNSVKANSLSSTDILHIKRLYPIVPKTPGTRERRSFGSALANFKERIQSLFKTD